jgi:hypothetical protein
VFSDDELDQARSVPIAERCGVKLKKQGAELHGACPICRAGDDRFIVWPKRNHWHCRQCGAGGDPIAFEMHVRRCSFVDAVRGLIGKDAGTPNRRQPMAEEIAARTARETERKQAEAKEQARNEASVARILAHLQPVWDTPGAAYLRDLRKIDVNHWAIRRALEDIETLGWSERVYFREEGHELHGQHLGAIIGILTDPVTGERTGGITRTYIHQGVKIGKAKSLGGVGRLGIIRLSPDEEILGGLHICEGIESALSLMQMGFCPMWAAGSTSQLKAFPVLAGVECLTIIADHDIADEAGKQASQQAARETRQRWANAGRETVMKIPKRPGEDANDILKRRARA